MNLYKLIKAEAIDAPFDEAIGGPFINTGVETATAQNYKDVIG